jgi:hypothetical protein
VSFAKKQVVWTDFEHLLSAISANGSTLMAPFTIYFDDSGTHEESNIAIAACYVSTAEKWARFETEWREIAAQEGFETFHMVDFAAAQGEFKGWADSKRRYVLGKLCSLINIRVRAGFIAGVRKLEYDNLFQGAFRDYCGRYHYSFVLRHCITGVRGWRNEFEPSCTLQYIFDQMGKGKGEIMAVMDKAIEKSQQDALNGSALALGGYAFQNKKLILPLQAADILAWTAFQFAQNKTENKPLGWIAKKALDLIDRAPIKNKIYDQASLISWAVAEQKEAASRGLIPVTAS